MPSFNNKKLPQKSHKQDIPGSIDQFCILRDACHDLFCIFGDFYASGKQDAEVTKSLVSHEKYYSTISIF